MNGRQFFGSGAANPTVRWRPTSDMRAGSNERPRRVEPAAIRLVEPGSQARESLSRPDLIDRTFAESCLQPGAGALADDLRDGNRPGRWQAGPFNEPLEKVGRRLFEQEIRPSGDYETCRKHDSEICPCVTDRADGKFGNNPSHETK